MEPSKCNTNSTFILKDSENLLEKFKENDNKRKLQLASQFAQDLNNVLKKYDNDCNSNIIPGYKNFSIIVDLLYTARYDSLTNLDEYANLILNEINVKK